MTIDAHLLLHRLLVDAVPEREEESGDWEDVLRRALVATEARATADAIRTVRFRPSLADRRARDAGRRFTSPRRRRTAEVAAEAVAHGHQPPDAQGWGTRPIRMGAASDASVSQGMGWGTRPM